MLNVPYFKQKNEWACGAAAFEMVYSFFRPSKLSALSVEKMFMKLAGPAGSDKTQLRISGVDLVNAAKNRGLYAGVGRVSVDRAQRLAQLHYFLHTAKVPIIACQRFTDEQPHLGHYRVVIAANDSQVVFHDPHPKHGGRSKVWPEEMFAGYWKFTGPDVTGGVAIWMAQQELASPLDPASPNWWRPPA